MIFIKKQLIELKSFFRYISLFNIKILKIFQRDLEKDHPPCYLYYEVGRLYDANSGYKKDFERSG